MKLSKASATGRGCGGMGSSCHNYWGIPIPQENKFLADDVTTAITTALADGCSCQAPCCSQAFVGCSTPPLTGARVGRSHGMVSRHPPDNPAKLLGSPKFSWHFLPAPTHILPSHSHDKHPSGSRVPLQASSKCLPERRPNLNEAIAVPLIYARTDTRLKMEASFRITRKKRCPSGG